jgi:hypothetical protein
MIFPIAGLYKNANILTTLNSMQGSKKDEMLRLPRPIHRKIARSKMDAGYEKKSLRLAIKIQARLILRSLERLLPLFRRM